MRDNYLCALSSSYERPKDNHPLILMMYWGWILCVFTLGISALLSGLLAATILHNKGGSLSKIRKCHLINIRQKAFPCGIAVIALSLLTASNMVFIAPFFVVSILATWLPLKGYIRYTDGLDVR